MHLRTCRAGGPPPMAAKVKGFFKGFKNIFAVKEHEMEIGLPTDVRHVAHVGWDTSSAHAPSWMKEFETSTDFASTSLSNLVDSTEAWDSLGQASALFNTSDDPPPARSKSIKRKKSKNSSSSSTRSSMASKFNAVEENGISPQSRIGVI